jgi:transcription elongation factor GreA
MTMATATFPMTKEGYETLKEELRRLKAEDRPQVIAAIAEARAHGDLSENAEYHAAKEKQSFIEARIADLDDKLSRAQIISNGEGEPEQVRFGVWVTLVDEDSGEKRKYRIVGDLESDIAQGKISISSPIGQALMGKRVDDTVEIRAPKGTIEYVITEIKY